MNPLLLTQRKPLLKKPLQLPRQRKSLKIVGS
jgi:hypothetical protein